MVYVVFTFSEEGEDVTEVMPTVASHAHRHHHGDSNNKVCMQEMEECQAKTAYY